VSGLAHQMRRSTFAMTCRILASVEPHTPLFGGGVRFLPKADVHLNTFPKLP
jgi:hypothetical protein